MKSLRLSIPLFREGGSLVYTTLLIRANSKKRVYLSHTVLHRGKEARSNHCGQQPGYKHPLADTNPLHYPARHQCKHWGGYGCKDYKTCWGYKCRGWAVATQPAEAQACPA